jgi:hypothetical protein
MDMDIDMDRYGFGYIAMDIHEKSADMGVKYHIHSNPAVGPKYRPLLSETGQCTHA